ncbi:DUF922 domain-containing Zn-dependent protease [Zhengella sp. ZM62]|uniref:DUF922 domain-containing Zn-dependent protease n=1 Tax=Zhengella sedimenti TaxID=3390035 RepID=UPI0039748524
MTLRSFAVSVLLAMAWSGQAPAADIRMIERHYDIGGATVQAIERQLASRGPRLGGHKGHPAATRMEFNTRVDYVETQRGCRVSGAHVRLVATMTLPRWKRPAGASADTARFWHALDADIRRHEKHHADIAAGHARQLERALTGLSSPDGCKALEARVETITTRIMKRNDDAHAAFDRKEGNEFERRLRKLIAERKRAVN